MDTTIINNRQSALLFLVIHCVFRDNELTPEETELMRNRLKTMGFPPDVSDAAFYDYSQMKIHVNDESNFLRSIFNLINPEEPLGLFSLIVQLAWCDGAESSDEHTFLNLCSSLLNVEELTSKQIQLTHGHQRILEQRIELDNIKAYGTVE